jgi:hypothetical protein
MTAFNFRRRQTRRRWAAGSTLVAALGVLFVAVFVVTPAFATRSANPAASLDQCANDPAPSPPTNGCSGAPGENGWVNGNLGSSKAVYREGDSIPYRLTFTNLATTAIHHVIIEWDTTKSSKHALDYIDTYNASVANANPCLGVSGCTGGPTTTLGIPGDPQITGFTQNAGSFSLWGGTITGVQAPSKVGSTTCNSTNTLGNYCYSAGTGFSGDKSAAIQVNFTATVANPVLAWGGHIATRQNWGNGAAAVNIPGSPYHTRLIDLDGSGGNQDRSLSAEAVIFPGFLHVVKNTTGGDATFGYTTSPNPPLANFNITTVSGTGEKDFNDIETFQTYTVNESTIPSHWAFDSLSCSPATGTGNGGSVTYSGTPATTASIVMKEGEEWTCTYANHHTVSSPSISTTLSETTGSVGDLVHDSATLTSATADAGGTVTYTMYTDSGCTQNGADFGTVTVTNGVVPDSNANAVNTAGTYYFQAVYSGDSNNNTATSGCTTEKLVISPNTAGISTAQNLLPNDSATLSGLTSGAGGTVTFELFSPSDASCSGTAAYSKTVNVSGNNTYSTDNSTFLASDVGTWRWKVVYSGDTNNTGATSACGVENFTITNG